MYFVGSIDYPNFVVDLPYFIKEDYSLNELIM